MPRNLHPLFKEKQTNWGLMFEDWSPRYGGLGPARWAYIYGFHCPGFYKIGQSSDWEKRLYITQSHCPLVLRKVHVVRVPSRGVYYGESYALRQMGEPVRGEWFPEEGRDDAEIRRILQRASTRAYAYRRHLEEYWEERHGTRLPAY